MISVTEILSPGLLAFLYFVLVLPWIFASQTRIRRLFGSRLSTFLNVLRCLVMLLLLLSFAGLVFEVPAEGNMKRAVILEDRSFSMLFPVSADTSVTRSALAEQAARDIVSRLESDWEIRRLWFGSAAVSAGDSTGVKKIEGSTDIDTALRSVLSEASRGEHIVLLSDGRVTLGRYGDADDLVSGLRSPVSILTVGGELDLFDASVVSLDFDEPVYQDDTVPLRIVLAGYGPGDGRVDLSVKLDGENVESSTVTLDGNGSRLEFESVLPPMQPGEHLAEVSITVDGEQYTLRNDRRSISLQVKRSRRSIALFTSVPDWDLTFFMRTVRSLPEYEAEMFVGRSESRVSRLSRSDRYEERTLLQVTDVLNSAGVIVLHGDVRLIPRTILQAVAENSREGGVGLLLIPTVSWQTATDWGELEGFCPYPSGSEKISALEGEILARTADANPVITKGLGERFTDWHEIPPLVYVQSGEELSSGYTELLTTSLAGGLRLPVLAELSGQGFRCLCFLGGGFWRWDMFPLQFGRGPYFQALSEGVLEWLSQPSLADGIQCEPSASSVRMGEGIFFRRSGTGEDILRTEIVVTGSGAADSTILVIPAGDGRSVSDEIFLDPGVYRYRALDRRSDRENAAGEGSFLVDGSSIEFDDPRPDARSLRDLASRTQGSLYTTDRLDELVSQMNSLADQRSGVRRIDPRREPVFYFLILLFFFTELFVRRRRGLP